MIRSAELKSVISDIQNYSSAFLTFEDQYDHIPGDFPDATKYWPASRDGDGDSTIEWNGPCEDKGAWQHLSLAELISGTYPYPCPSGGYIAGTNLPASKLNGGMFWIRNGTVANPDYTFSYLIFASKTGTYPNNGIITPAEAKKIDKKMDDGTRIGGRLLAPRGDDLASGCSDGADYDLSDAEKSCYLSFILKK